MAILTKNQILQGINQITQIKIEALDGELWLRPLSSAEVNEILNIEAQGYGTINANNNARGQTQAEGKMNLAKMQEKQAEAKYTAIHKSINNDKSSDEWSYEEIKDLPSNAIDEIYNKIMELSGADVTERDVKQFPED
jgi:hypothetical protein